MITILNTSILTAFGDYSYLECSPDAARKLVADGYQSAVGHQATADILSELLGVPVQMNRIEYRQQPGDRALVFKLNGRAPEGVILSREEIEKMGYSFGVLTRR